MSEDLNAVITLKPLKAAEGKKNKQKKQTLLGLESVCLLIFILSSVLTFVLPQTLKVIQTLLFQQCN